ncbi:MAG: M48 family metalloprotease [candidate division WOR-3 bacterium]|nr:M48 family metalloprotease [candidate division WOR-3 bacterium]
MRRRTLYGMIAANRWRTFGFILLFAVILALVGGAVIRFLQYYYGVYSLIPYVLFGFFIVGYNIIFFFTAKKLALFANGARRADPAEYKRLHNVVEEMAIASGQPKPEVYIIHDPAPNAFATGRNPRNAAIAVTTGLYEMMDRAELQGVVAHEMSHIRNHDILLMTIVAIMIGLVVLARDLFWRWGFFLGRGRRRSSGKGGGYLALIWLAIGLVLAILAPLAVMLIRAAISRQREYLADASAAMMTRNPEGLARALEKIGSTFQKMHRTSTATAHLFISSPKCKDRPDPKKPQAKVKVNLFSSHPPIQLRVERLRGLNLSSPYARQFEWPRTEGKESMAP